MAEYRESKLHLVRLLSFLSYNTFHLINASEYRRFCADEERFHISKVKAKYLL